MHQDSRETGPNDPNNEIALKRPSVRGDVAEAIVELMNGGDPQWRQKLRRAAMTRQRAQAQTTTPAPDNTRGPIHPELTTPASSTQHETFEAVDDKPESDDEEVEILRASLEQVKTELKQEQSRAAHSLGEAINNRKLATEAQRQAQTADEALLKFQEGMARERAGWKEAQLWHREAAESHPSSRPRPILDLKGIELGMTANAYRAIKADLLSSIDHNLHRCSWTEKDCVTHVARALPLSFKTAAVKMATTTRLFAFLDQQFLSETSDLDEEEWEEMRIGVRTVAEFATDIEAIAERLDKTEEQTNRCFVKGFREDYPELWRRLRIDHEGRPLTGLVRIAKQWIELTRGHESKTPRARVAAVTPSPSNEAALLADLSRPHRSGPQARKPIGERTQKSPGSLARSHSGRDRQTPMDRGLRPAYRYHQRLRVCTTPEWASRLRKGALSS